VLHPRRAGQERSGEQDVSFEPVVLFFVLGLGGGLMRSDLKIPGALYDTLSIFLLLAIGLKGGVELAKHPLADVLLDGMVIVLAGAVIPSRFRLCGLWDVCRGRTLLPSPPITAR
jgi:hypothetical protein